MTDSEEPRGREEGTAKAKEKKMMTERRQGKMIAKRSKLNKLPSLRSPLRGGGKWPKLNCSCNRSRLKLLRPA